MDIEILSLLMLAFGLGMLHALDADHIVAISGMSCHRPGKKSSLLYCARWALGHGAVLLLIGASVMFLGMAIPQELSEYAENLVGIVLIVIGLFVLWDIRQQQLHLHFHQHDGMQNHAHWHSHDGQENTQKNLSHKSDRHQHSHAPVFVGVIHGTAGSAPLLVLLPLSQMSSPWTGMGYLFLFGLGVFVSMLIFGGLIGQVFSLMKRWGNNFIKFLRIGVSLISIGYGVKLLMATF